MDGDKVILSTLSHYIQSEYQVALESDENLFNTAMIDSQGFLELILYIEEKFGVTLDAEDLTEDNFRSLKTITTLITSKNSKLNEFQNNIALQKIGSTEAN